MDKNRNQVISENVEKLTLFLENNVNDYNSKEWVTSLFAMAHGMLKQNGRNDDQIKEWYDGHFEHYKNVYKYLNNDEAN